MKKLLFLGGLLMVLLVACSKNNNDAPVSRPFDTSRPAGSLYAQFKIDSLKIDAYLKEKNITAQQDPSGIFYRVINPGTGTDVIKVTSFPTVGYKGYLLNGTVFDASDSTNFGFQAQMRDLIPGWYLGLTKIHKGGQIQIFLPSKFAYGERAFSFTYNGVSDSIRSNSVLVFDVKLFDFKDINQ
ncbi:FKBP-type peptidyl-prolyl cis-trans isomerase [Chitinophaga vietnamensis]|uniref:FKBP-type peptidyl-prolyl cis-trans isomerase n=1 Tax=Chitinophaga vietnamensis TaxID=2593957 RepID=UPI00137596B4|nr:FKBP-type peptidyl-prolyl cis-trans isomerase [Chitinophaga vietnamensis]